MISIHQNLILERLRTPVRRAFSYGLRQRLDLQLKIVSFMNATDMLILLFFFFLAYIQWLFIDGDIVLTNPHSQLVPTQVIITFHYSEAFMVLLFF